MKLFNVFVVALFLSAGLLFTACESDGGGGGAQECVITNPVTYCWNGSTRGDVPEDTTEYNAGEEVTVLDNTGVLVGPEIRDGIGQRFVEWNTDPDGLGDAYDPDDTFSFSEETKLYAIYTTGDDVLRKVGPAGGWVFYDEGSYESWGRYLEAWNEDESGEYKWKTTQTSTGGTSTAIGTGYANTGYEIEGVTTGMIGDEHPAADVVRKATHGGYEDWFLPSKDELNKMYVNLKQHGVGGFAGNAYWSSSELNASDAWGQVFSGGHQGYNGKNYAYRVRAVRAF